MRKLALIEAPLPNAPEGKYISQIPSPNNLLTVASALKVAFPRLKKCDLKLYQFLKERKPPMVQAEFVIYNLGEATCMDYEYNYAADYLRALRFWNQPRQIILTGYHAWLHRKRFTREGYLVTAPYTFEDDVVDAVARAGGKSMRARARLHGSKKRVQWHNDWTVNDWDWMRKNVRSVSRGVRCTIRATKGCPYSCTMCPVNVVYSRRKMARNSHGWILDEIATLYGEHGIREIGFLDDNLFCDLSWGKKLLRSILGRGFKGLRFTLEEGLDVPTACNKELVGLLKQARFYHTKLGVESLNPATLKLIGKPYTNPELALRAIKNLQAHKLNPTCFLCFGFATDTEEFLREEIKVFTDLGVRLRVQILWQYPGVKVAGQCPIPNAKLRELQREAMEATGSCSWTHKEKKK